MPGTQGNEGFQENRTPKDDDAATRPIPCNESDGLGKRIDEIIGAESKRAFARRCGFSDGLLNAYIKEQKTPGLAHFRAMAEAGGVTLDWLATGKGIKYSRDLREQLEQEARAPQRQPGREQAVQALASQLLPRRERFLDCNGREREFELSLRSQAEGVLAVAQEVEPLDFPGYSFGARSSNRDDAFERLRARIRAGLSRRYLVEVQGQGLQLLSDEIEGEVWGEGLVVDGRMIDYDEIRRLLTSREDRRVTILIRDGVE